MYKNNSEDELLITHKKEDMSYLLWNRSNWTPYCENDRCWDELVTIQNNKVVSREEFKGGVEHYLIHEEDLYIAYWDSRTDEFDRELVISCNGNIVHSITDKEESYYESIFVPLGRQLYLRRTQAITGNIITIYIPNKPIWYY